MVSSILAISLRSRSRVRSSRLNSLRGRSGKFPASHVVDRSVHFFHQLLFPSHEDLPEVFQLVLVHVLLALFRLVRFEPVNRQDLGSRFLLRHLSLHSWEQFPEKYQNPARGAIQPGRGGKPGILARNGITVK